MLRAVMLIALALTHGTLSVEKLTFRSNFDSNFQKKSQKKRKIFNLGYAVTFMTARPKDINTFWQDVQLPTIS
jgi:hypothetical protein